MNRSQFLGDIKRFGLRVANLVEKIGPVFRVA